MTRKFPVLLALALTTGAASVAADEMTGTLKKIADSKTIVLGHRESAVPFAYYDENQKVVGYSYDLAQKIVEAVKAELKLADLQVKLIPVTAQNRIPLLLNDTIDLECGATTNNPERRNQVAFSNTLFIAGIRLMTKRDSGIKDFSDLAKKTVVTTKGTTSETLLRKLDKEQKLGLKFLVEKEHGIAFKQLETGRAKAFVMDDVLLAGERAKAGNPAEWVITGTPQSREAYGCILRKEDGPFKKLVDEALAKAMTSGEAEVLYKKWFESPIPPKRANLDYPLSEDMRGLFKEPNDREF